MATSGYPGAVGVEIEYVEFFVASNVAQNPQDATASPVASPTDNSNVQIASAVARTSTTNHVTSRPREVRSRAQGSSDDDAFSDAPSPPPPMSDPEMIARSKKMLTRLRNRHQVMCQQVSDPGPVQRNLKPKHGREIADHPTRKVVVAIYDYSPIGDDDLSFVTGDVLEVLRDGYLWWFARDPVTGHVGYIPKNHVRPYSVPAGPVTVDHRTSSWLAIATQNFKSTKGEEINFVKGDVFIVLNNVGNWWYVRQIRTRKEGFVQRALIQPMRSMPKEKRHTFSI